MSRGRPQAAASRAERDELESPLGLEAYRAKRNFERTSEPHGGSSRLADGHSFVVQEHAASRLHYDFRLELDGLLKSWAVTKGPSLVPTEKRLAVEVEDHPIEYGGFEGTIPKGQYGGGSVIIWDRGTWEPKGDPHEGLAKGRLDFILHGEKLKGYWHLVRMGARRGNKRNWLLIKGKDEEAREASEPDILVDEAQSVVSGRTVNEVGEDNQIGRTSPAAKARPAAKAPGICAALLHSKLHS